MSVAIEALFLLLGLGFLILFLPKRQTKQHRIVYVVAPQGSRETQSLDDLLKNGERPKVSGDTVIEISYGEGKRKYQLYLAGNQLVIQEIGTRGGIRQIQVPLYGVLQTLIRLGIIWEYNIDTGGIDSADRGE